LAFVQLNPTVGDLRGNAEQIKFYLSKADEGGADLVIFPELALTGYPPEDLLLRRDFLERTEEYLAEVVSFTSTLETVAVVGYPKLTREGFVYNALGVIYRGRLLGEYYKHYLPNYGVFDEYRYFKRGRGLLTLTYGDGTKVGFLICEDVWHPTLAREYALEGVHLLVVINASPFEVGKFERKLKFVSARSTDGLHFTAYGNLVGGNDSLVFDGRSFLVDPSGRLAFVAPAFEEGVFFAELDPAAAVRARLKDQRVKEASLFERSSEPVFNLSLDRKTAPYLDWEFPPYEPPEFEEEVFSALVTGVRDYFKKQGFERAILGLSGGVDSALTAVVAAEALGPDRVLALYMPTRFNSDESYEDAAALAANLGIGFEVVEVEPFFERFEELFSARFENWSFDTADENLQARIRAVVLFYYSNKTGALVLSTSNKSEAAVGYTTIYGDMAGGFAPLKDVYKTWVYRLARWYNRRRGREVIPERILTKPPSAELRPGQTDQDALPPYEVLDRILQLYLEEGLSDREIAQRGFDLGVVEKVLAMLHRAEYKRKQSPLGVKVTKTSFDKDWRFPVVKKV